MPRARTRTVYQFRGSPSYRNNCGYIGKMARPLHAAAVVITIGNFSHKPVKTQATQAWYSSTQASMATMAIAIIFGVIMTFYKAKFSAFSVSQCITTGRQASCL
jgi:hypothetical protein